MVFSGRQKLIPVHWKAWKVKAFQEPGLLMSTAKQEELNRNREAEAWLTKIVAIPL